MSALTEKQDFLVKLEQLIKEFEDANPDLFIRDVDIVSGINGFGEPVHMGIRVEVVVK